MDADILALCVARASTTVIFTMLNRINSVSARKGYIPSITSGINVYIVKHAFKLVRANLR